MSLKKEKPSINESHIDNFVPGKKFMQSLADFKAKRGINAKGDNSLYRDNIAMHNSDIADDYKIIRKIEFFIAMIEKNKEIKYKKDRIEKAEKQLKEIIQRYKETTGIFNSAEKLLNILDKIE